MTAISLLVGSRDRVPVTDTTSNWTTQLNNNWTQPTNIWVAIQPRSGLVTAGEVLPPYQYIGATWFTMNQSRDRGQPGAQLPAAGRGFGQQRARFFVARRTDVGSMTWEHA